MILKHINAYHKILIMSKKLLLSGIFLAGLLFSSAGFGQAENDSVVEGIVAVVGGNIILKSDIENQYLQIWIEYGLL